MRKPQRACGLVSKKEKEKLISVYSGVMIRSLDPSPAERVVLDLYPWPLPLRIAGYITAVGATISLLVATSHHIIDFVITLVLGPLFLLAFHKLSGPLCATNHTLRFLLFSFQICSAVVLFHLSFSDGAILLFFMLASEAQFLLPFRPALGVTAALWVATILEGLASGSITTAGQVVSFCVTTPAGFAFVAAFTRSAITELVQRHQTTVLLDELNQAHAQLQTYADQVEELTTARERNRLAREIHDTVGHYLTVINVQIEAAQKLSTRDHARSQAALSTAKQLAAECLSEVRRSVAALRPAALDQFSLAEAVGRLINEFRRTTELTIHFETYGSEGALTPAAEVAAYRVIQEALTNVRRHAHAANVWIRLEWGQQWFIASVRDDGQGAMRSPIDDDGAPKSHAQRSAFGLHSMRERLAAVDGTLEISTAPGAGFCVTLRIPRQAAGEANARTVDKSTESVSVA
jgi:signal transduction histidine kinase